jgi:hypothetical protein
LEVAPSGWNTGADPTKPWAVPTYQTVDSGIANDSFVSNNASGIGLGYKNSDLIKTQNGVYNASTNNYAAGAARAYTNNSKTDWYLPTTAELNLLCQWNRNVTQDVATRCTGGTLNTGTGATGSAFVSNFYWSSSEYDASEAWGHSFIDGVQARANKLNGNYVRPVRAF